ncbi:MAG: hypothetical protein MJ247_01060 [Alphaproteobacteria bacterium]|nr:hypothetical protein [Alphaproteobacteria bacterium]
MKRNNILLSVIFVFYCLAFAQAKALETDNADKFSLEYKKVPASENNDKAEKSLKVEAALVDKSVNDEAKKKNEEIRKLIKENKELLSSFEKCNALKQKIKANLALGIFGAMFQGLDTAFDIEIKGYNQNNNCDLSVRNLVEDIEVSRYDCSFNKEQMNELKEALLDDSGKEITRKVEAKKTFEQNNVNSSFDFSFEITAEPAIVVWSDLSSRFCDAKTHKMTEDEEKIISRKMMSFSKEFEKKMKRCEPGKEDKSVVFVPMVTEIVGKENGKCHVKLSPFDLYLNDDQLNKISAVVDLTDLYKDESIAIYNPTYDAFGILNGLSQCIGNKKDWVYTGGTQTSTIGKDVSIKKGIQIRRLDNGCEVRFGNILTRNNNPKGYGKKCLIPIEKVSQLIGEYKDLLPNDEGFQFGSKTIEADKKIGKFIETQYCN